MRTNPLADGKCYWFELVGTQIDDLYSLRVCYGESPFLVAKLSFISCKRAMASLAMLNDQRV